MFGYIPPFSLEGAARRLKMGLYKAVHAAVGFAAVTDGHCRRVHRRYIESGGQPKPANAVGAFKMDSHRPSFWNT
jgi:hypothetical protein